MFYLIYILWNFNYHNFNFKQKLSQTCLIVSPCIQILGNYWSFSINLGRYYITLVSIFLHLLDNFKIVLKLRVLVNIMIIPCCYYAFLSAILGNITIKLHCMRDYCFLFYRSVSTSRVDEIDGSVKPSLLIDWQTMIDDINLSTNNNFWHVENRNITSFALQ